MFIFSTPGLIRHLWQLKAVVFLHWCLICYVLLFEYQNLLLLSDIWWLKFKYIFYCCLFFSTTVLIRHLLQLKTAVFLHRCLMCSVLLFCFFNFSLLVPALSWLNLNPLIVIMRQVFYHRGTDSG